MPYDDVPGADPRGPICPGCSAPVLSDEPRVLIHSYKSAVYWHAGCSRPMWDTLSPILLRLRWWPR